jgi:HSP20 family protein
MAEKKKGEVSKKKDEELQVEREAPSRMLSPFEEMDRMMESFFPRRWMQPFRWEMPHFPELAELKMPKVDIIDRDTEIVVKAELPGVAKDDIDLSITDNTVTIKASTSHEEKEETGNYYRCEISRGSFSRTVALPGDVDADKAKASFSDGILELTMPKMEKSHRKSIAVE